MSTKDQILFYYAPLTVVVITMLYSLHLGFNQFINVLIMFGIGYLYMSFINFVTYWYKKMKNSKVSGAFVVAVFIVGAGGLVYLNLLF